MRFGKSYEEAKNEVVDGGQYMKYFKDADTTFRILEEPKEWTSYWEHFNPGGFSFPCTTDKKTCPGCTSSNEKMKKASRKIAFNVLEGEFVNVYKVPKTVADKLDNRAQRNGTIMDRDYTISKIQTKNSDGSLKTDYDIEGQDKRPIDASAYKLHDIEEMLERAFNESWGDSDRTQQTQDNLQYEEAQEKLKAKLAAAEKEQPEEPPFDSASDRGNEYEEKDLRAMDHEQIIEVVKSEGLNWESIEDQSVDQIVDWLLVQV